jgi:integrase
MGISSPGRDHYLRRFDIYAANVGATKLDRDCVEGWVKTELARGVTARGWMSYIRDFGRWYALHRDSGAYVLSANWKSAYHQPEPYLLTTSQIDSFFAAIPRANLTPVWQRQSTAFFALMHSCGLRTIEARRLKVSDMDFEAKAMMVTGSKGRRDRRLPITEEIARLMLATDEVARTRFPQREFFFTAQLGGPIKSDAPGATFKHIWDTAGLPWPRTGRRPSPYAFRHHFAYSNIERWMRDGTDVQAMLPYLQIYMGHACVESTYYYIHTSPDFLADYATIVGEVSASHLPEVGFE